jgi:hypothetical protein
MKRFIPNSFFLLLFILIWSCKSDSPDTSVQPVLTEGQTEKYKLTPVSRSPDFPDASIESMTYENGRFTFEVGGDDYELGAQTSDASTKMCANSAQGQHIHLILGRQPYTAHYTSEFDHSIPDGRYNLLAFLSRSYHESIKTPQAKIAKRVQVQNGTITSSDDIRQPMLFYSRPKGTYVGDDTKKILLDFYLVNAELGRDFKVKVQINGEVKILSEWQPYFIEGLPYGQNSIGVALIYPDGSDVEGSQTSVLHRIMLTADPLPEQ